MLAEKLKWSACQTTILVCVLSLPVWAESPPEVWLTPINPTVSTSDFKMLVRGIGEDGSGEVLMISVIRMEESTPVSSLSAKIVCSQGLAVCGLAYDGQNIFHPTFIFLDQTMAWTLNPCDIAFVLTYPAYSYLSKFDWNAPDKGVRYFDSRRIAPNFIGIEGWKSDYDNCGEP